MKKSGMGQDKFIELDVRKLKDFEAERKRLLASVMQKGSDIKLMCCPRCNNSLNEKIISDIKIVLCEQCSGGWIDKKSLVKLLVLFGDTADCLLDQV